MSETRLARLSPATLAKMVNSSAKRNRVLQERVKRLTKEANKPPARGEWPDAAYEVVCDLCHISTRYDYDRDQVDPIEIDFVGFVFDDYGPKEDGGADESQEIRSIRISPAQALHFGIALLQAARVHGLDIRDFDVSQLYAAGRE